MHLLITYPSVDVREPFICIHIYICLQPLLRVVCIYKQLLHDKPKYLHGLTAEGTKRRIPTLSHTTLRKENRSTQKMWFGDLIAIHSCCCELRVFWVLSHIFI